VVLIEVDDEIWNIYKRSWALFGVKTHAELVRMLERYMEEGSMEVLNGAERILISDEPEALVRREIGLAKERIVEKQFRDLSYYFE